MTQHPESAAAYRPLSRHPAIIWGGRFMLSWAFLVMPATSIVTYAQGLPTPSTTSQKDWAAEARTQDEGTANQLINQRASRLMRSQYQTGAALRAPNLTEDTSIPIRTPKVIADPGDADRAAKQAARVTQRSREDMVRSAQSANSVALDNYERMDFHKNTMETKRSDPGANQTTRHRANVNEMLPGFSDKQVTELHTAGAEMYHNPEKIEAVAGQNRRNLRRDGCRRTQFVLKSKQDIDAAASSPEHRVLKVEFFDIEKVAIPNTNPVEYQSITKPTTFKRGRVDMLRATLGGVSNVVWEQVDETFAIRYTYTPFAEPKGRNYFTYNHWFGVSRGGAIERVIDPGLASYGTPSDGWKPVAGYTVPYGVTAAYLAADLYQAEVTYTKPVEGSPCPPDPPEQCEVDSVGGDRVRWCPGALGANIVLMYDDAANPNPDRVGKDFNDRFAANAGRNDFRGNADLRTGVMRAVNAGNSDLAKQLVGSCRRDSVSRVQLIQGGSYGDPDIQRCSETLVNPYPQGCQGIKRSFGLAYVGEHNFMTVTAFNKVRVPIIDPATKAQVKDAEGQPLFTYRKDLMNVEGALRTDFTIMGAATCPAGENCTTEKLPDDPRGSSEGPYVEYRHTPMGGDPKLFVVNGIYAQAGGAGNFSDYGVSESSWMPTGSLTGDGTLHEVRLMAKIYSVATNGFSGCERYMQYAADGFCKGAKLTCTDTSPTRTVGDVTFGPGLPNRGIVELLKKWGTDASAVVAPEYEEGVGAEPSPNGPPLKLLDDPMCWQANAEAFTSCAAMEVSSKLKTFMRDGASWATDCNITTDDNDVPLESSPSCKRAPTRDECDNRFKGIFTGQCYNPTIAYDCGTTRELKIPVAVEEQGDACSGAMRCLGTECHRPNLTGSQQGDFARAVSGMEAVNQMVNEMVCEETGEPPKSVDEPCTPYIFGGKAMYCKIPIGHQIGLTPQCCKEARKGAKSAPSWMEYLQAMSALNKLRRTQAVQNVMANSDIYNSVSSTFGDVSAEITNMYSSAANWVTDNLVTPFRASFDGLIGSDATSEVASMGIDGASKGLGIDGLMTQFQQLLYKGINEVLMKIGGQELAGMVFQTAPSGALQFTPGMEQLMEGISTVMMVYSIARLIGHIIFACKQEEYEWGMNDKWRLCTDVGSCCSKKKFLVGCIEKRQLYCCYKSIVSRVISEQIVSKNLTGRRAYGFRTSKDGRQLGGCDINCGGFTAFELAAVDWSQVDLSEWTDTLIEAGILNPANPASNFGVAQNRVKSSMAIARNPDEGNSYDQRSPAIKSAEILGENVDKAAAFNHSLKDDVEEHCYDANKKKMPFVYPGCKRTP